MKHSFTIIATFIFSATIISGCSGSNSSNVAEKTEMATQQNAESLPTEFLGNYHGIQPGYFMKNQYGDDMIINGKKIPVPSIDYKFLLKENNVVGLQQINLEDNTRVYYDGTYKIIANDTSKTKIECSLSDGTTSHPTYVLTINNLDKKGICNGNNEPEFSVEKSK